MTKDELGRELKKLRERRGLTQAEVARKAQFGLGVIKKAEPDDNSYTAQYPSIESLFAWLKALDTTPAAFFSDIEKDHSQGGIRIVPGFEPDYKLLTDIIESKKKFFVRGIQANLVAMRLAASTSDGATAEEEGNLSDREKKKSRKQRRTS